MSMSTSSSGVAKIHRAINHIESAARLIASLPSIYHEGKERRETVRNIVSELQDISDKIRAEVTKFNSPLR